MRFATIGLLSVICLVALPACGGNTEVQSTDAGAHGDAGGTQPDTGPVVGAQPVSATQMLGKSFVFVGVQSNAALIVRGGAQPTMMAVTKQPSGPYLLAIQAAWSGQSGQMVATDPCTVRDDDGVPAGDGLVGGQMSMAGQTSPRPANPVSVWSSVAAKASTDLLAGNTLTASSIFGSAGLAVGLHATGSVQCSFSGFGTDGGNSTFAGAGLVGTEAEVDQWWAALGQLIPAP